MFQADEAPGRFWDSGKTSTPRAAGEAGPWGVASVLLKQRGFLFRDNEKLWHVWDWLAFHHPFGCDALENGPEEAGSGQRFPGVRWGPGWLA